MTIEVQITNKDAARSLEVVELQCNRATLAKHETEVTILRPGESRTFHCYMLRDFIIREQDPTGRS